MSNIKSLKIPHDRIGAIIGKKGKTKEEIEKKCDIRIDIDGDNGAVTVIPNDRLDIISISKGVNIIDAISKGFAPEKALLILEDDIGYQSIDLKDYSGKSPNSLERIKSRLIGEKGKARRTIEELTDTYISIYGHHVGIIGKIDQIDKTEDAIKKIITGSSHKYVYNFLQEIRRKNKIEKMQLWEKQEDTERTLTVSDERNLGI